MSLNIRLIDASKNGKMEDVKYLIRQGANVRFAGDKALLSAIDNNHLDVVKYLVDHGADKNMALVWASEEGNLDFVKYLLKIGANINTGEDLPFRMAAKNGHLEVVKYLLTHGVNTWGLQTGLGWAARENHLDIVKYIIEHSKINGEFALKEAAEKGYLDIIKYLLEQGVDPTPVLRNKSKFYKPEVYNYIYRYGYALPRMRNINYQIENAPVRRFKSFPQGGIKYQENPYRGQWTRVGQEISNAPPTHIKELPKGGSGFQEVKEWLEREYPEEP